ncbi:hypothetical protein D4764_03G0008780 [Takifugu flavidus]|uniref:Uncharacterized protein n=1 Tax=Takifugu flavidus TaxID=433684 RepID=A0A5C6ND66_9TELE|nr:hypothetical protein D4764_03G0008780 [Takifugu flavidus]
MRRSVSEAFWAMCAADSMSMPVHWYYNIDDIKRDFGGWISGFNSPRDRHPSSILTLSNTSRVCFIQLPSSFSGLQAGENTLNVLCALRAAQTLVSGRFTDFSQPDAQAAVLSNYVDFLTTPGTHNDTYAESFHRSFFADWQDTSPSSPGQVLKFAEKRSRQKLSSSHPDSQLDAIGCLTTILPFILLSASANEEQAVSSAVEFVKLTHPHPNVPEYVELYSRALHAVLGGASVRQQAEHALRRLHVWDVCQSYSRRAARFAVSSEKRLKVHQSAVSYLGLACYTKGALSSLFYLAYEFHDNPREGILTNTNCGGSYTRKQTGIDFENIHH